MTKHYILSLDPNAQYEWDRCALRDPMTAARPALADLVAAEVGEQPGAYLVAINIEVTVLEKTALPQENTPLPLTEKPLRTPLPQFEELVA